MYREVERRDREGSASGTIGRTQAGMDDKHTNSNLRSVSIDTTSVLPSNSPMMSFTATAATEGPHIKKHLSVGKFQRRRGVFQFTHVANVLRYIVYSKEQLCYLISNVFRNSQEQNT